LDDIVTVVTTQCHFTTQLRIYSSSSNNGYAVIQSTMPITKIAVNAGNKTDTLNVYGSNDGGTTWTLIEGISVTSTSYKDYATTTAFSYKWLKLDVAGTQQVRVASMTLTLDTSTQGESDCEHTTTEPIGEAKDATCTEDGITAGEKCAACGAVITEQETIPATGHSFANGVCVCGAEKNALVTNVEDLQVGDRIVIVAKDSNYAMSTEQNTNNRGQAAVTKDANGAVGQDAQVLTLKAGMVEGTFALYTGEGYLYAASSASNHLKTDDVKTANGSWKIEIDAEGIATIKAQGDNERNWMRYNSNSGLFACYESGQQDVVIYKLANSAALDAVEHIYTSGSETVAKDYANINDALTVTKGTLKLLADQTIGEVDFNGVVIDLNGHTLTADTIVACVTDTAAKKGLIKVAAQDDVVLTKADGDQLILWDNTTGATGFRVFDAAFTAAGMNLKNDDTDYAKSFWSDLDFADSYAYQMVASTVSGLNVGFKLNLNGVEKTFWFSEDVLTTNMRDWGDSKYSNTSSEIDYYFYITVTGFANLQEAGVLNVTPVVQDYFGNIVETSESIEFAVG